ncbi:phosphatidylinositol 3 and 4-kinase-domain-containing protein, partial [Baffinella frigidus]
EAIGSCAKSKQNPNPDPTKQDAAFAKVQAYTQPEPSDMKRQDAAFAKVKADTQPVFRHFFLEQSSSALEWFRMRLAYTRSVAASSMAGFIVGLGDRHPSNILVRQDPARFGEVVHIDLGIVFDQGKLLSIPEMLPFRLTRDMGKLLSIPEMLPVRLTRDMVDGMGVAGTAGVMTRGCEETLRVLRDNKQAILAIVDVLLHDPLDSWKMTKAKAAQQQAKGSGSTSTSEVEEVEVQSADGRLVRRAFQDKLKGWDRGEMLGVEGQVKQLIRDATDHQNLARIFNGWAAWL